MFTCDGDHTWGKCDRDNCDFERFIPELDLSSCPYFQGTGTCESGCYSEPSCFTDRPSEGWPSEAKAG